MFAVHFETERDRRYLLSPHLVPELLPARLSAHAKLDPLVSVTAAITTATPITIAKIISIVIGNPVVSLAQAEYQFQFWESTQLAVEHDSSPVRREPPFGVRARP